MSLAPVYLDPAARAKSPTEDELSLLCVGALKADRRLLRNFVRLFTLTFDPLPNVDAGVGANLAAALKASTRLRVDFQPTIGRTARPALPSLRPDISVTGWSPSHRTFQLLVEAKIKAPIGRDPRSKQLQTTRYARAWDARHTGEAKVRVTSASSLHTRSCASAKESGIS